MRVLKIVFLLVGCILVANALPMSSLPLKALTDFETESGSSPLFSQGQGNSIRRKMSNALNRSDVWNAREARFWAPWSSVSASTRGRFHSGSVSY